jgi:hypothetical protein
MEKRIASFTATGKSGTQYEIVVTQEMIDAATRSDPNRLVGGVKTLRTSQGQLVNRIKKGHYEIVGPGTELHSDDVNAL